MIIIRSKFLRSMAKICAIASIFTLSYSNAFAKSISIMCPTVTTTLTHGYKTTSGGYRWTSWQTQPDLQISTAQDKNYFAEISQSHKGITLKCIGSSGSQHYGFYTNAPKVAYCKIDSTNKGFICESKV